ncbi:MAG TPA: ATP-dependent DNA helicase RecG [Steroidobacteraceae bacterium]|nr:ATP-dependent DNA helicase RecG [Steroidobacteraceae bacterium]
MKPPAPAASGTPAPLTRLRGVGPALVARLEKLGVRTLDDLLFLLPLRYEDRTRVEPLGALRHGQSAVVEGEVQLAEIVIRRRRQLLVRIADGTGALTLRFFHFSSTQREGFVRGLRLRCYGEARRGPLGLEMVHPEYRRVAEDDPGLEQTLTPVYPSTEGITQPRLRALVDAALDTLAPGSDLELLPAELLAARELPPLRAALEFVHRPPVGAQLGELAQGRAPAQRRLAFEELIAHQLSLLELRQRTRARNATALHDHAGFEQRLLASLPFRLTGAQQRVLAEVHADLAAQVPMTRLIQGDVGCGKTVVAAAAAARAIGAGFQVALMAPTELLAEQHLRSLFDWFDPLGVRVVRLSGTQTAKQRRTALQELASGEAQVVVGTHALFQEGVAFKALALAIIDEQHRFGVQQRLLLQQKGLGFTPHQLIMTATPIPRTLAMTAYADLDVSVIDELPPGRKPVRTVVLPEERRAEIVARIAASCQAGQQAYWVCALIEESEELGWQAAEETAALLTEALPRVRVGLVHGRLTGAQKDAIMRSFTKGEIQLLVATTVIEVGVDVPNASIMVIENAERMGLAQLHQLRGRVGRGTAESSCVLLYRAPLSELGRARLAALRETNDGFEIARRDLQLRGPGELLGTRQTGLADLRVADLLRDADLLPEVRESAALLMSRHPERVAPLIQRWIGEGTRYGSVG